jgi:ribosome-associated toxin RatA of RatAB toxin-antitoxin module
VRADSREARNWQGFRAGGDAMKRLHKLALGLVILAMCCVSGGGAAMAGETTGRQAKTESIRIPGSKLVRGRTTLVVGAPLAKVRSTVLDFAHYPDFMPHFRKCRVLGRSPSGGRDIYMEVAALHGAVRLWARIDAKKPVKMGEVEIHELAFVEGNVNELSAIWRLKPIDARTTELSLEIFLHPKLPLPARMINEENVGGSAMGATAVRARAER